MLSAAQSSGDVLLSARIPYTAHVSPSIVRTRAGDYVCAFRLAGIGFEAADEETLNHWHERLNILWRNLASPHVAFWTHLIRRRATTYPAGEFAPGFAADLNHHYRERFSRETLLINEWFVTLVYRPQANALSAFTLKAMARRDAGAQAQELTESLDACGKLADHMSAGLARYRPQRLSVYAHQGRHGSELLEYLSLLINGEPQRVFLPRVPLAESLGTSRLLFGREALEIRTATHTRLAAALGIKEYATPTTPGMLNASLSAPYPLVLSQSFTCLSRAAAQGLLQRQAHRLDNAGDFSRTQAEELHTALDQLTSSHFVMGQHHASLWVHSDDAPVGQGAGHHFLLRQLNDRVAHARAWASDAGLTIAREDLALEAAYWAQLPGQFASRPRHAPITSRNWSALSAFHNYPSGRANGNAWGEAVTVLTTPARSPFYFSFHAARGFGEEQGNREGAGAGENPHNNKGGDVGHTLICGPTGSGKTVLIGFLLSMLTRQGVTQVVFDKDHGLEILVRALGGEYRALINGVSTGFNPLQLDPTGANMEFLRLWLRTLLGGAALSATQTADLDQALRGTIQLALPSRRLSRLIEFLDPTDGEGLFARLSPWCASTGGEWAWVFDHPQDHIADALTGSQSPTLIGFDVTDFIDHSGLRTPITLYLFHLVRQLLDGRRLVCWLDEFWRLLADPAFEAFAKEGPKTWRKLNGLMVFATQSASDVLASPISRTIVEQTATQIYFPNAQAQTSDYRDGLGLSAREFRLVREAMNPSSRSFLIKQGHDSVVAELDLRTATDVTVISGRAHTVALLHRLIDECGDAPSDWLPAFLQAVQSPAPNPTPDSRSAP
jgi:type IV secretion system protein VirB4